MRTTILRSTVRVAVAVLLLAGCATSPNWHRPEISDKTTESMQLAKDTSYCDLASSGAVPMPALPAAPSGPQTTNVTLQGRTYDQATGTWSNTTYRGQVTTGVPTGGFAGGMASGINSGMALGAAMKANRRREELFNACMRTKGWTDAPEITKIALNEQPEATPPAVPKKVVVQIYDSSDAEWIADIEEFLWLYPSYKAEENFKQLMQRVRQITIAKANISTITRIDNRKILLQAHDELRDEGIAIAPPTDAARKSAVLSYRDAVNENALGQLSLAVLHSTESTNQPNSTGLNQKRAAFWAQKAALAGNVMGQTMFGLCLFHGDGVKRNKVDGYRWVKKAAATDADAQKILRDMSQNMTTAELAAASP